MPEDIRSSKKVLMISSQNIITNLSDGGKRVSNRNWRLLCDIFGWDNVRLVEFDKTKRRKEIDQDLDGHIVAVCQFDNIADRVLFCAKGKFLRKLSL